MASEISYRVTAFDGSYNRKAFSSTSEALNRYLKTQASQDIKRRLAACYLLVTGENKVAGYYTLSAMSIPLPDLPDELKAKLPRYPTIPAVLLGRLAVDMRHAGKGLGGVLLVDAIKRSKAAEIAAYAMVADAKDQGATEFYQHFGFIPFEGKPTSLFLPLGNIRI